MVTILLVLSGCQAPSVCLIWSWCFWLGIFPFELCCYEEAEMRPWLLWICVPSFVPPLCHSSGSAHHPSSLPPVPPAPSSCLPAPSWWQPLGCGCFLSGHVQAGRKINTISFELRHQPFLHGNNWKEVIFLLQFTNLKEFRFLFQTKFPVSVSNVTAISSWVQKLLERVWQDQQANGIIT